MLTNMTRTWNYPNSFFPAGGSRVFHPRAVLSDVHVCRGVGDSGPEHPSAALSPLEVQTVPHSHLLIFEISKWVMVNNSPSLFLPQVFPPSCRRVWGYVWSSECDECRHSELLPKRVLVQARLLPSLLFLLFVQVNPPQSYIIYQFRYPMLCYLMLGCYWWHYYDLLHHLRGTKDFSKWTK